ncbi:hypothetical protein TNCV_2346991 [Trichonephila clavipes]|nr:hypothetical protein TNCV_2346991 [Trichonephila clavipes]
MYISGKQAMIRRKAEMIPVFKIIRQILKNIVSPAAKAAESASAPGTSKKDDGFTTVGRNGKRIAPIVIDAQSNATELLTQIGNLCSNSSLQGRFENGKLRVFPTSAEEHRIIQKFVSDKKNAVAYIRDGPQQTT